MVASCLTEAGYKTGLYTSPHLVRENERIKINNIEISNTDLERLAKKVDSYTEFNINFFERFTAIAFLYFEEQKCDYVVLEVGLGGRLDATNIIKKSEVSAITNLGLEHTEILGDTIEKIAFEKAGIIKENGRVILYPSEEKAVNVAKDIAKKKNATIKMVDFQKTIPTNLYGEYQKRNAATAVAILKELNIDFDLIFSWISKDQKVNKELLYKGTRDGDKASTFHSLCDNKGPTLVIIVTENGSICGGYTTKNWDGSYNYHADKNAFIFSLDKKKKYPPKLPKYAIYCCSTEGPSFGWGDLTVCDSYFTQAKNHNQSYYYTFPTGELVGTKGNLNFLVKEVEVYKITLSD